MNDSLIDDLAMNLKPVKPLRAWPLWLGCGVGLVVAMIYVVGFYDLRADVKSGALPVMAVVKPLIFMVTGLFALWAVSVLARPEGRLRSVHIAPVLILLGLVIAATLMDMTVYGFDHLREGLNGGMRTCYVTILCGGMAGLVIIWRLWLRRSATSHPLMLGAMAGLAVSSLMAAAYSLHCDMDAPVYILLVYGLSVAVITALAALLGSRFLRW